MQCKCFLGVILWFAIIFLLMQDVFKRFHKCVIIFSNSDFADNIFVIHLNAFVVVADFVVCSTRAYFPI